ncbi:ABC transporter ATP-binding protein/permease [Eikenella corrodens]|uniref:ABC transporter ATP-binding protein/permease n=1 Tax=Eikenella corrodens TaxID=539 RepID=UPI0009BE2868|nr:ABC transporter ATP-binding protein/permease [Eikenella corrodens]
MTAPTPNINKPPAAGTFTLRFLLWLNLAFCIISGILILLDYGFEAVAGIMPAAPPAAEQAAAAAQAAEKTPWWQIFLATNIGGILIAGLSLLLARFLFFRRLSWFIKDYWLRAAAFKAVFWLSVMTGFGFAVVAINVQINAWSKTFYDTLNALEAAKLYALISQYLIYVAIFILCAVSRAWLRKFLIIRWRQHLTEYFLNQWFAKRAYYRIALKQSTDNPDQRIADDINIFVSRSIELFVSLLTNLAQLYAFIAILWNLSGTHTFHLFGRSLTITGYLVWIAVVYSLFGSLFTQIIGKKLHKLNYDQQKFEADFRASLVRKHDNAEQIALYHGEVREQAGLKREFGEIVGNWRRLMAKELHLGLFTTGYDRFSLMLPVLASVPLFLAKKITLGGLMQIRSAFTAVFNSLSWFVFAYSILPEWSATLLRLSQFRENIGEEQEQDKTAPAGSQAVLENLTLQTPGGETILSGIRARITPKSWTQLAGQSGLGKSTLLRTIGGLWPYYDGVWQQPPGTSLLLPQKTYLGKGTLAEILSYPAEEHTANDDACRRVLQQVGLAKWADSLHDTRNWPHTLSAGEQQRIAFARALLVRPDYLYLDENTSALDTQSARSLLQLIKQELPHTTVVLVSHQPELADLYDEVLDLEQFRPA